MKYLTLPHLDFFFQLCNLMQAILVSSLYPQGAILSKKIHESKAAVKCGPVPYSLAGVRLGSGMMGKLGRAWVGAWLQLHSDFF